MGLSLWKYEVIACDYELYRHLDSQGEVSSSLKGGNIRIEIADFPDDNLMAWVFDHAKRYNGEITIHDTDQESLEHLYFENARCVDFKMHYHPNKKEYMATTLLVIAETVKVGDVEFENVNR